MIAILDYDMGNLRSVSKAVEHVGGKCAVTRDPKDDYLLAYALVGKADYLVTGDEDLLELEQVDALKIVTAREFLTVLETVQPE